MALSFTEQGRADIGGREFRCYQVTSDGSTKTIEASDVDMHYFESAMVGQKADHGGTQSLDMDALTDTFGSTVTVTHTGAVLGDFLLHATSIDMVDVVVTGYVQAGAATEIRVCNESGAEVDYGDTTYHVRVPRNIGLETTNGTFIVFSPALQSGDTFSLAVIGY